MLQAQCHTCGAGDTLTQAAGGHIHTGNGVHVGVALQIGVNAAQGLQIFHREETTMCQGGVQTGGGVALGQDETVPVFPLGVLGIYIQFLCVQISKQLSCRQAAAGVAALGAIGRFDDTHAHLAGKDLQLFLGIQIHG